MDLQQAAVIFPHADPVELAKFVDRLKVTAGCWLITINVGKSGYAQLSVFRNGKRTPRLVHQLSYEWTTGQPAPARGSGFHLDHSCDTRNCVRPDHIRKVTTRANVTTLATMGNYNKTHCIKGHPFDAQNTYIDKKGKRLCRECQRQRSNAWKRKVGYKTQH